MLRNVNGLLGYAIRATDGDLGEVNEFYFDDETWTIRYLVVATGTWLSGRTVLLSPAALGEPDWEARTFGANLTIEQVRDSPDIETAAPVSRQHEMDLVGYYAWPAYWGSGCPGGHMYGTAPLGPQMSVKTGTRDGASTPGTHEDPHLRSTRSVAGYHIEATDGAIGHVEDYMADDQSWVLRFMIGDTRSWLPRTRVLLSPQWITRVEWAASRVIVDLPREASRGAPLLPHCSRLALTMQANSTTTTTAGPVVEP